MERTAAQSRNMQKDINLSKKQNVQYIRPVYSTRVYVGLLVVEVKYSCSTKGLLLKSQCSIKNLQFKLFKKKRSICTPLPIQPYCTTATPLPIHHYCTTATPLLLGGRQKIALMPRSDSHHGESMCHKHFKGRFVVFRNPQNVFHESLNLENRSVSDVTFIGSHKSSLVSLITFEIEANILPQYHKIGIVVYLFLLFLTHQCKHLSL